MTPGELGRYPTVGERCLTIGDLRWPMPSTASRVELRKRHNSHEKKRRQNTKKRLAELKAVLGHAGQKMSQQMILRTANKTIKDLVYTEQTHAAKVEQLQMKRKMLEARRSNLLESKSYRLRLKTAVAGGHCLCCQQNLSAGVYGCHGHQLGASAHYPWPGTVGVVSPGTVIHTAAHQPLVRYDAVSPVHQPMVALVPRQPTPRAAVPVNPVAAIPPLLPPPGSYPLGSQVHYVTPYMDQLDIQGSHVNTHHHPAVIPCLPASFVRPPTR